MLAPSAVDTHGYGVPSTPKSGVPSTSEEPAAEEGEREPWEHPSMVAQRKNAVAYAVARAAAKLWQQQRVMALGLFVCFGLGANLIALGFTTYGRQRELQIGGMLAFNVGICIMLSTDFDLNEHLRSRPHFFDAIVAQMVCANAAFFLSWFLFQHAASETTWASAVVSTPFLVWVVWRRREIRTAVAMLREEEEEEGEGEGGGGNPASFPLSTELVGIHFFFYFLGHLGWLVTKLVIANGAFSTRLMPLASPGTGTWRTHARNSSTLAVTFVTVYALLWISLARSRWGQRPRPRLWKWLAMAEDTTTPTIRCFLCTFITILCWVMIICLNLLLPEEGAIRPNAPVLYVLCVVLPMVATWVKREVLFGALNAMFERGRRLQDGGFVASLLGSAAETLRVGDEWWVNDPEAPSGTPRPAWFRATVTAIGEDGKLVVDLPAQISLPPSVRRRTFVAALPRMTPGELVRCACSSLFHLELRQLAPEHLLLSRTGTGSVEAAVGASLGFLAANGGLGHGGSGLDSIRKPCRPGETDWFVSHSWHDDRAAKQGALDAIGAGFRKREGREPTIWFDRVCVHPAFHQESLHCLPVYLHACRSVLVLCGPTYLTRLWCVWELYTLFAFADDPCLVVAVLRGNDEDDGSGRSGSGGGQDGWRRGSGGGVKVVPGHEATTLALADGATHGPAVSASASASSSSSSSSSSSCFTALRVMQQRLAHFSLAGAHCSDPNEERQLRAAIEAAPGGKSAFQATIRGLAERLTDRPDAEQADASGNLDDDVLTIGTIFGTKITAVNHSPVRPSHGVQVVV